MKSLLNKNQETESLKDLNKELDEALTEKSKKLETEIAKF